MSTYPPNVPDNVNLEELLACLKTLAAQYPTHIHHSDGLYSMQELPDGFNFDIDPGRGAIFAIKSEGRMVKITICYCIECGGNPSLKALMEVPITSLHEEVGLKEKGTGDITKYD